MGNSPKETLIIWIDKNVDEGENEFTQKKIKKLDDIELKCFKSIEGAIKYFEEIKFQKTIIITSGGFYHSLIEQLRDRTSILSFIPRIIIFTRDAEKYISINKNNNSLFDDPFFNIGGVKDLTNHIMTFIKNSLNKYNPEFEKKKENYFTDDIFKFLKISNKEELILPIHYHKYLKVAKEEEIKKFNQKIFDKYEDIPTLSFLFSQLAEAGNIPTSLLSKFWLRAYSAKNEFCTNMNKDLLKKKYNDYLPMILKLYEGANKGPIETDCSELYKGILIEDGEKDGSEFQNFIKNFNGKEGQTPEGIIYGSSFFSFYKDKDRIDEYRKISKSKMDRRTSFISLILEKSYNFRFLKNLAIITEDMSYFEYKDEVVFFPFSCFEVKKIEKSKKEQNEYTITLKYLGEYTDNDPKKISFKDVPENDFSKLVFESGIIDYDSIEMPSWFAIPKYDTIIFDNISIIKDINNNKNNNNESEIESNEENRDISREIFKSDNPINNQFNNNNNNNNDTYHYMNNFLSSNPINQIINTSTNNSTLIMIKGFNNVELLEYIKKACSDAITENNYNNLKELENNILTKLSQNYSYKWLAIVSDKEINTNTMPNNDMSVIFQYKSTNWNYFIYVFYMMV